MKQNTSTPAFLSLRDSDGQNTSPLEWSSDYYFNPKQHQFCKVQISSPTTTNARRVSTASSGTNAISSELSCIPSSVSLSSSSSSSIGAKSNDDTDESLDSSSISEYDDPIISFDALSLSTQGFSLGPRTGKTLFKSKSTLQGMNTPPDNDKEPPIESLNLAPSFECKDRFSLSRRSNDSSSNQTQQRRRSSSKKYTIKKTTSATQNTAATEFEAQKEARAKRQRGGSDFTMASASADSPAAKSSPRKRRRVNRNQAMAAQDFESILSQINYTGSL